MRKERLTRLAANGRAIAAGRWRLALAGDSLIAITPSVRTGISAPSDYGWAGRI